MTTTTTTNDKPRAFVLSLTLQAMGHELTKEQALFLDAAQALKAEFMRRARVAQKDVERIAKHFLGLSQVQCKEAIRQLIESGIIALETSDNNRRTIHLTMKLKGLDRDEITDENAGVGKMIVPAEKDQSLRQQCESEEFARELLKNSGWNHDCHHLFSVPALMVLSTLRAMAVVNQLPMKQLRHLCEQAGMTNEEFSEGCEELDEKECVMFHRCSRTDKVIVFLMVEGDNSECITAEEAIEAVA